MVLVDLLGTIVSTAEFQFNIIGGYTNITNLFASSNYYILNNLCNIILTTLAQSFIARQIYLVNRSWWAASAVIGFFIVAELALGLYGTGILASFHSLLNLTEEKFKLTTGFYNVLVLACDLVATISLCIVLRISRNEFKSTNELLSSLLRTFIGRGVLLVIFQAVFVILWFIEVSTFYWMPFFLITGKLYVTTLIALLNLRPRNRIGNRSGSKSITFKNPGWSQFGNRRGRRPTL